MRRSSSAWCDAITSTRAAQRADDVLRKWNSYAPKFVKVFPKDLKLALDARINAGTGNG